MIQSTIRKLHWSHTRKLSTIKMWIWLKETSVTILYKSLAMCFDDNTGHNKCVPLQVCCGFFDFCSTFVLPPCAVCGQLMHRPQQSMSNHPRGS